MAHIVTITPNPFEAFSKFKLRATCSCQWEALAIDQVQAEGFKNMHLYIHGVTPETIVHDIPETKVEKPSAKKAKTN